MGSLLPNSTCFIPPPQVTFFGCLFSPVKKVKLLTQDTKEGRINAVALGLRQGSCIYFLILKNYQKIQEFNHDRPKVCPHQQHELFVRYV
jgi:hypothetical protein